MLDIKKIIENKDLYSQGLSNRGYDISNLDEVISFLKSMPDCPKVYENEHILKKNVCVLLMLRLVYYNYFRTNTI